MATKKVTKGHKLPAETLAKLESNAYEIKPDVDEKVVDKIDEVRENSNKTVEYNENINYKARGFKSLEDAIAFAKSPRFECLGDADKQEYLKWLKED